MRRLIAAAIAGVLVVTGLLVVGSTPVAAERPPTAGPPGGPATSAKADKASGKPEKTRGGRGSTSGSTGRPEHAGPRRPAPVPEVADPPPAAAPARPPADAPTPVPERAPVSPPGSVQRPRPPVPPVASGPGEGAGAVDEEAAPLEVPAAAGGVPVLAPLAPVPGRAAHEAQLADRARAAGAARPTRAETAPAEVRAAVIERPEAPTVPSVLPTEASPSRSAGGRSGLVLGLLGALLVFTGGSMLGGAAVRSARGSRSAGGAGGEVVGP